MKSAVSLVLVVCLVSTTFPVAAQEPADTVGPIRRAIPLQAAWLASVQQKHATDPGWRRVIAVAPGAQLIVADRYGRVRIGYFAGADESGLTVLNLSGAPIPAAARRALRDAVSERPGYFVGIQEGQTYLVGKNVRLSHDGVFVTDQKVADLDQLVETIARGDITKIAGTAKTGGSIPGAIGGASAGALLGLLSAVRLAFTPCGGSCRDEEFLMGLSLVGLPVLGGVLGYRAGSHSVQDVIYPAP